MKPHPFVAAVIPAKMTSIRLKGKNLIELCGYPLIYYSIKLAQLVPKVDSIYVSSESPEVLEYSTGFGINAIKRPPYLSEPNITNQDVLKHTYESICKKENLKPDLIVLLQPTHPLRIPKDLDQAIECMNRNESYDSLFTLVHVPDILGRIIDGSFVAEFGLSGDKNKKPKMFRKTGSLYIFRPEKSFLTTRFFGKKICPYLVDRPEFEVDIDYEKNYQEARSIFEKYKEHFSHFFNT